jgi:hypothetical protein
MTSKDFFGPPFNTYYWYDDPLLSPQHAGLTSLVTYLYNNALVQAAYLYCPHATGYKVMTGVWFHRFGDQDHLRTTTYNYALINMAVHTCSLTLFTA